MSVQKGSSEGEPELVLDVYGRVSQLVDERQRSVEGQVKDCKGRVRDVGARLGEVLTDPGRSAWDPRVRRPGWDTLMDRLESGATGGVVVFDLSRFSRRPIDGERLIKAAEKGLVVLDTEDAYDLTAPNGKKAFRDHLNAAAYYSDRLSTVTRRGKRDKALSGEPNATRQRAFGFEPDAVTVRESEAAVIRELVTRLLDGAKWDHLAVELNERGILTAAAPCDRHKAPRKGRCSWCGRRDAAGIGDGLWTPTSLRNMLKRSRNAGYVTYKGEDVARLSGDPILDGETWQRFSTWLAGRRRGRPNSEVYLCSGVALCGLCGKGLTGRPQKHLRPYPDGEFRRQYWCLPRVPASKGGCGKLAIDMRELDYHMREFTVTALSDSRHSAIVEAAAKSIQSTRAKLEGQIDDAEQLANALADKLGRGEMKLERYEVAAPPLETRLTELRGQLAELDTLPVPEATDEDLAASRAEWEARWDAETTTTAERRELIKRALRGRRLVIAPLDKHAPRKFDRNRIRIEAPTRPAFSNQT